MRQLLIAVLALGTFASFQPAVLSQTVDSDRVRVSEDKRGDGHFTVRGFVEIFDKKSSTAESVYNYNTDCIVSYGGTTFVPQNNKTTLAVIETSDGTTLFGVHDAPNQEGHCPHQIGDNIGGSSYNQYELHSGGMLGCLVRDDPPGSEYKYTGCGSSNLVTADQTWQATNTDGIVLGPLGERPWRLDMSYLNSPDNIEEVVVLSGGGDGVVNLTPPTTIRLEKAVNVQIDIKPGSKPNYFDINDHDVIPVAMLGKEDFEVDLIDQSTLKFVGFSVRLRGNDNPYCSIKNVNSDSYPDLVCYFVDDSSEWTAGNDTAELWGELNDTTPFYGEGKLWIVPPKK